MVNHFLVELFTIDEVRMLLVNPCCFQNVCGCKVLKLHVNVMILEVVKDAPLNAKHLVRRSKSEVDNGGKAWSSLRREFDVDGELLKISRKIFGCGDWVFGR